MKSTFTRSSADQNWFWALLSATVFFYIMVLVGIGLCFGYYTGVHAGDCRLHEFFISFNMILCIILSVTSVLPVIQEHQPNSGLLQASFVSLYIMYLTWSAMSNYPNKTCKPDLSTWFGNEDSMILTIQCSWFSFQKVEPVMLLCPSVAMMMSRLSGSLIMSDLPWTQPQSLAWSSGLPVSCTPPSDPAPMLKLQGTRVIYIF